MKPALFHGQPVRTANNVASSGLRNSKERGMALITCLLLMILMSILGLGMVVSVNSDMLINGYYGNYRSAYYAADSGLNIARQQLMDQTSLVVNQTACASWGGTTAGCTLPPVNAAGATTAINAVLASWGGGLSNTFHPLQSTNSWPGSFQIPNTTSCPATYSLLSTTPDGIGGYVFNFQYTLCVLGRGADPLHVTQVTTTETGQVQLQVDLGSTTGGSTTTPTSFASFGAFISNFAAHSAPLVSGTITGPQFTNGSWNFGTAGNYIFTDTVSQAGAKVSYDFASRGGGYTYVDSTLTKASYNGQTIAPNFQGGLAVGVASAPLPANDYSQKWAVLDGMGCGEGSNVCGNSSSPDPPLVTNTNLSTYLEDINGSAYKSGSTSGVYLPYSGSTLTGGGFYVEGNATSITLTPGTDGKGNLTQIYAIVQGSSTTYITTNVTANTTTVSSGSKTTTLTGVPQNKGSGTAQTMLYVDGNIGGKSGGSSYTGLSGPGQGMAAVQDGTQLTIVANGDVNVVGDILYKSEPVTLNTADALISANDHNQVLGLFTQTGNFVLTSTYGNNNLEIDASIAALGNSCAASSCGLSTPTSDGIDTLTIVGGRMEVNAHGVVMKAANTYFDRRFQSRASQGFAPPWFPSTTVSKTVIPPIPTAPNAGNPIATRLTWMTSPQN